MKSDLVQSIVAQRMGKPLPLCSDASEQLLLLDDSDAAQLFGRLCVYYGVKPPRPSMEQLLGHTPLTNIKGLDLKQCYLNDFHWKPFAHLLSLLQNLESLDVSCCRLDDERVAEMAFALLQQPAAELRILKLANNPLVTSLGAKALLSLSGLPNLKYVDVNATSVLPMYQQKLQRTFNM